MLHLTACKISVSLSFLNWIKNEKIFYRASELMLAILIHRYDQKSFHFKNERLTQTLQAVRLPHFMILFIPYINLLNLSWKIKCLFSEECRAF